MPLNVPPSATYDSALRNAVGSFSLLPNPPSAASVVMSMPICSSGGAAQILPNPPSAASVVMSMPICSSGGAAQILPSDIVHPQNVPAPTLPFVARVEDAESGGKELVQTETYLNDTESDSSSDDCPSPPPGSVVVDLYGICQDILTANGGVPPMRRPFASSPLVLTSLAVLPDNLEHLSIFSHERSPANMRNAVMQHVLRLNNMAGVVLPTASVDVPAAASVDVPAAASVAVPAAASVAVPAAASVAVPAAASVAVPAAASVAVPAAASVAVPAAASVAVPAAASAAVPAAASVGTSPSKVRNAIMQQVLCIDSTSEKKRKTIEFTADFDEATFAGLMCLGTENDVVFHKEIRQCASMAGMDRMSNENLEKYVFKIFGQKAYNASKEVQGTRKQARGYKHLRFVHRSESDHVGMSTPRVKGGPARMPPSSPTLMHSAPKVARLMPPTAAIIPQASDAPLPGEALALMPLLSADTRVGDDNASTWQKSVMALVHESLGTATLSVATADDSDNIGVGLVLSKDRRDNIVVSRILAGGSAAMSPELIKVGDRVMRVDASIIMNETSLENVCRMIMGKPGSMVQIKLYSDHISACREITLVRRPPNSGIVAAPGVDKIFFYGGLQEDRDKCIGRLQRDHDAYCILPVQSSAPKIADLFSKCDTNKSLVVIEYEEMRRTCGDSGKDTKMKNEKIQNANEKTRKKAQATARCLTIGRFWHDVRGPVSFDPPKNIFVFSNEQPYDRSEWQGWVFFHISDKIA